MNKENTGQLLLRISQIFDEEDIERRSGVDMSIALLAKKHRLTADTMFAQWMRCAIKYQRTWDDVSQSCVDILDRFITEDKLAQRDKRKLQQERIRARKHAQMQLKGDEPEIKRLRSCGWTQVEHEYQQFISSKTQNQPMLTSATPTQGNPVKTRTAFSDQSSAWNSMSKQPSNSRGSAAVKIALSLNNTPGLDLPGHIEIEGPVTPPGTQTVPRSSPLSSQLLSTADMLDQTDRKLLEGLCHVCFYEWREAAYTHRLSQQSWLVCEHCDKRFCPFCASALLLERHVRGCKWAIMRTHEAQKVAVVCTSHRCKRPAQKTCKNRLGRQCAECCRKSGYSCTLRTHMRDPDAAPPKQQRKRGKKRNTQLLESSSQTAATASLHIKVAKKVKRDGLMLLR